MKVRSQHPGRSLFLLFMLASFGSIFMIVPLVNALESSRGSSFLQAQAGGSASAGSSSAKGAGPAAQARQSSFEQIDRNKDGMLDKSEAAAVPGLSANFERADANRDGKLDKVEFAKALSLLDTRK